MHPMTLSQLTDRQLLQPSIPPDLLEQLHHRPHPDRPPHRRRQGDLNEGGANIRDDTPHPPDGKITTPDGANIHVERGPEWRQIR